MSESATSPTPFTSSIDLKGITIKATSGVAMFWLINKFLESDDGYMQYLKVGLVGASGLTIMAPIIQNVLDGKDLLSGVKLDKDMLKMFVVDGALTAGLYYAIKMLINVDGSENIIKKYAVIVASVIGTDMLSSVVMSKLF